MTQRESERHFEIVRYCLERFGLFAFPRIMLKVVVVVVLALGSS